MSDSSFDLIFSSHLYNLKLLVTFSQRKRLIYGVNTLLLPICYLNSNRKKHKKGDNNSDKTINQGFMKFNETITEDCAILVTDQLQNKQSRCKNNLHEKIKMRTVHKKELKQYFY